VAALSVILSGVILNFGTTLTNNAFDVLFWTLAAYILVIILEEDRPRLWLAFGLTAGVALQNKYSILFLIAALGIGLVLSPARKRLLSVWPWAGAAVALAVVSPNLIWQLSHGLPFVELNRNAVLSKNAVLSPLRFLGSQVMEAGPVVFLMILAGMLVFLTARGTRSLRAFGWAYPVLTAVFIFSGGKTYYMASVYPVMLAAGAVGIEALSSGPARRWIRRAVVVLLIATAAPGIPFALPVLSVDRFISYSRSLGVTPAPNE
jgi:4-amino-4-deoxy-L-arabinose transferase-like glycosyltransferase